MLIVALTGCSAPQVAPLDNATPAMNAQFMLTEDALRCKTKLAKQGNMEAMGDVYSYYTFGEWNEHRSNYWLKRMAFLGHPPSEYNYGHMLFYSGKTKEGLQWIRRSGEHGFYAAPDFLKEQK